MSSKKTTNSDKYGYHLSANADDWSWKIRKLFWEKSREGPVIEITTLTEEDY